MCGLSSAVEQSSGAWTFLWPLLSAGGISIPGITGFTQAVGITVDSCGPATRGGGGVAEVYTNDSSNQVVIVPGFSIF